MEDRNDFKKAVNEIGSLNSLITVMNYYNINLKKDSSGYFTNCMFHNDKNPSMRLTDKGQKALYNCFSCNAKGDIINFICHMENTDNITALKKAYEILGRELIYNNKDSKLESFKYFIRKNNEVFTKNNETYKLEDIYIYQSKEGKSIYCKTKYKNENNKKHFITKPLIEYENNFKYGTSTDFNNCEKVLYNLVNVKKAIEKDNYIFFVEGEKDVETLKKLNLVATTIYTKKWYDSYSEDLQNSKIIFIGDSGKSGEEFKNFVVNKLKKCCKSLKVVNLPNIDKIGDGKNKDITDWFENGYSLNDLRLVVKNTVDILDKNQLQQDEKGVYKIIVTEKEEKVYLTNFQILSATLHRNNNEQWLYLNLLSNRDRKDTLKMDGRICFSDESIFRKYLGFDYIFYGDMKDLVKLHEYILNYLVKETKEIL